MKKILLISAMLGLASQANSDPAPQSNWYILAGTSYTWGDGYEPETLGGRGGESGFGWTLGTGWVVNERLNFELAGTSKNLSVKAGEDIDQYGLEGNGLIFLNRNSRMAPFLLLGIGGVDNSRAPSQGFEMYASAGLGFVSRLGEGPGSATLRFEARAIEELGKRSLNDGVMNLSLQIPVGSAN